MNPLVSVIIPTYNVEKYIEKAIQSVLDQTYPNIEIIVVDDGSTDHTVDVVRSFHDERIKLFINERNMGPSYSRNRGIKEAKGEWIAFLDGDDWWDKERLEKLLNVAETYQADVVCDDLYLIVDGETKPWTTQFAYKGLDIEKPCQFYAEKLIKHDLGVHPVIRKAFLVDNQLSFDERLRYGEDIHLYLECFMAGARWILVPQAFYYYRARKGSLITDKINLLKQTLETTKHLMKNDKYINNKPVYDALLGRKIKIEQSLLYYNIIQPIKEGDFFLGLSRLLRKPSVFLLIIRRLPSVFRYRVIRHFKSCLTMRRCN